MRKAVVASVAALSLAACGAHKRTTPPHASPVTQARNPLPVAASDRLPPSAERAYRAIATRFDRDSALEIVTFMDRYWRLAGNPGFDASICRTLTAA